MKRRGAAILGWALLAGCAAAAERDYPADVEALLAGLGDEAKPRFRSWPSEITSAPGARTEFQRLVPYAPAGDRWRLQWLTGQANETSFDRRLAVGAYTAAIAAATTPLERATGQLGLARVQSFAAPAAAEAILVGLAGVPRAAAAAAQLRARMALTAGNLDVARTRLGEALAAIGANPDLDSPAMLQSVTADLALVATFAGDLETAAAYAGASGVGSGRPFFPTFRSPAFCNAAAGLLAEDAVIFEVSVFDGKPRRITPVWSRRVNAADAIAALGRILTTWRWTDGPAPPGLQRGIRMQVSCSPGGRWLGDGGVTDVQFSGFDWLATKGIAPLPFVQQPPELLAESHAAGLAAAEVRYGISGLELVPYLLALGGNPSIEPAVRRAHNERVMSIIESAEAPPMLLAGLRVSLSFGENSSAAADEISAKTPALLARLPAADRDSPLALDLRMILATAQLENNEIGAGTAGLRSLLAVPFDRLPRADPLRRAVQERLARIADDDGRRGEADRLRRDAGLPLDLCNYADEPVHPLGITIDPSRFPHVLRREDIGGFVVIERRVAADSTTRDARILYAQPPLLFDKESLAAFVGTRNIDPRRGGKPFACTGNPQPIFWQLKDQRAK